MKEKSDGKWTLPGGWAEPGLTLSENVVKDVKEETGYDVETERILAVLDRNRYNHPPSAYYIYKIFVLCRLIGGSPRKSLETDDSLFFPFHYLPELSLQRVTQEQIKLVIHAALSGKVFHD